MDGMTPELCAECGYDSRRWQVRDAATLFGALGFWWGLAMADVGNDELIRRPAPGVWSVLEYGLHSAMVTAIIRTGLELMLADDGCALPAAPPMAGVEGHDALQLDAGEVLAALEKEGAAMAGISVPAVPWNNTGRLSGQTLQAEATLLHAAHDASHHFFDVARGLASLGAGVPPARGRVEQVNVSGGGVPKRAVDSARVDGDGLDGDRQADRKHHGRQFQAVSLWSADVIDELKAAGHPIGAGLAGENLTLRGIEWATLRPGALVRAGSALLELSFPAIPCKKQTAWFADGDFTRIAHENNPEWTRWYAWVREPGEVEAGDEVRIGAGAAVRG